MSDEEPIRLEGEKSQTPGEHDYDRNRSYHLVVLRPGTLGENVLVKLISSPFDHETGLETGTEIELERLQYEALRINQPHVDAENDPDLTKYNFPQKVLNRLRAYNPESLRKLKEEKDGGTNIFDLI